MRQTRMRHILMTSLLAVIGIGALMLPGQSQNIASYHAGDAVQYGDTVYIGTTDNGVLELFTLEEGEIYKKTEMVSPEGEDMSFKDLAFSKEGGKLYVYLVNGRYFYKYDLATPQAPEKVRKTKDNSWYWYNGVKKHGDKVITLGNKGIRVHRENGTVIATHNVHNNISENVTFSPQKNFIFHSTNKELRVRSVASDRDISRMDLVNQKEDEGIRGVYNDASESLLYVVDDKAVKAMDFNGNVVKSFDHNSDQGVDIIPSADPRFVYFSDGIGVVKALKSDLSPQEWKFTTQVGDSKNGWAMDIERVGRGNEEKVVVFNYSSLLVLDNNMEVVDSIEAERNDYSPVEPLYLNLDKNRAAPNSRVMLSGGGFGLYEELNIHFADREFEAEAGENGEFSRIVEVPQVLPTKTDITVEGERTGRDYSIGFEIE